MATRRAKTSGTKTATCDKCGIEHPSTVAGKRHRRCGGSMGAPIRAKHSPAGGVRGTWR